MTVKYPKLLKSIEKYSKLLISTLKYPKVPKSTQKYIKVREIRGFFTGGDHKSSQKHSKLPKKVLKSTENTQN